MGSYENPEQVKDYTMDVANAWANATNSAVKDITDLGQAKIAEYKANTEKYKANLVEAQKLKVKYASKVNEAAEGYSGADLRKTFTGMADEYANLQLSLMNNTADDPGAAMEKLSKLDRLPELAKNSIATLMSEKGTHNTRLATAGQAGGYDVQNMNLLDNKNNKFKGLNSIYGNEPANQEIKINTDKNGDYSFDFVSRDINGGWESTINSSAILKMKTNGTPILPYSPDAAADLNETLKGSPIYGTVKKMDKATGKEIVENIGAADEFYKFGWEDTPDYVEGKIKQVNLGTLDYDALKKNIITQKNFTAKADAYLANPDQAAALMNSAGFQDPKTAKAYTAEQFATATADPNSPTAIQFKEALANYFAHTFPPTRNKVDEQGNPLTQVKTADVTTDVQRATELANQGKPPVPGEKTQVLSRGKKWNVTKDKNNKTKANIIK